MLASIARNTVSVTRQKTIGGERLIAANSGQGAELTNLAQPVIPATVLCEIRDKDCICNSSVVITGTDADGETITETVDFNGTRFAQGLTLFTTVTSVQTANMEDDYVYVKYRGKDGSQVKAQDALFSCIQCQISYTQQSWPNGRSGTVESGKVKFMIPLLCNSADQKLRAGDLITDLDSGYQFLVVGMAYIDGVGLNRFQVVYGERRERT
jgi:hypothetical protein